MALMMAESAACGEKVEILRDTYGIPHVFAETAGGAYYGAGWAEAEDQAPAMALTVIRAQGRQAEFTFAASPDPGTIDRDARSRALKYYELAADWEKLPEDVKTALIAYARGFNEYVASAKKSGALEKRFKAERGINGAALLTAYGEITPRDLAAVMIFKNTEESISNMTDFEKKVMKPKSAPTPDDARDEDEGAGSNGVAIAAALTKSGSPILYGDPHVEWTGVQRLAHLKAPGFELFGNFQGPFMISGMGNGKAVAQTRNNPDGADIYIERINIKNREQYMYDKQWTNMRKEEVEIKVQGREPVKRTIYYTRHGWVVDYPPDTSFPGYAHSIRIAVCDVENDPGSAIHIVEQNFRQSWANSVAELYSASRIPYAAFRSFVSADEANDILYFWLGRVPVRSGDINPNNNFYYGAPVYGWNKWTEWGEGTWTLGDAEYQLPAYFNPRGGIIRSANNAPWRAYGCEDGEGRPEWIPGHVVQQGLEETTRGMMLKESLCGKKAKRNIEDIRKLAFNTLCPDARNFMSAINNGWEEYGEELKIPGISADAAALDSILRDWNYRADIDQPGMTAMFHLQRITELSWFDADYIPTKNEMTTYIQELDKTAEIMKKLYNRLEVPWGEIHVLRRGGKDIPMPGGTARIQSIFMAHMGSMNDPETQVIRDRMYGDANTERSSADIGKILCNFGSSFIHAHVLDPENPVIMTITPQGQINENFFPKSEHLLQQTEKFAAGEWFSVPLKYEDVKSQRCPWGDMSDHEHEGATVLKVDAKLFSQSLK